MAADPVNFSFLTVEERIFIARSRLPRTHQYLWGVMVLENHLKAAVQFDFHGQTTDAASRIAASTIFQLIATTLLVESAGIWERFDPAGFSIPRFAPH
ncbi:hypothetical protein AB4Y85_16145 [Microvirga sp. 2YAF29]|uniref:hypothetical protein n=1 Tax=Microvirga sp. 2YAF29 TaxID=3233031 RepID=UPI003F99CA5E